MMSVSCKIRPRSCATPILVGAVNMFYKKILTCFVIASLFIKPFHVLSAEKGPYEGDISASFNCSMELSKVEKMICTDALLSDNDAKMSVLYKKALNLSSNQEELKSMQREWLRKRNECKDKACVGNSYIMQLGKLRYWAAIESVNNPFGMIISNDRFPDYYSSNPKDIKACELLVENINIIDKFSRANWNCDFPISSMIRGIKMPDWREVKGPPNPNVDGRDTRTGTFSIPYNLEGMGEISIYNYIYGDYFCSEGFDRPIRSKIWFKALSEPPANINNPDRDTLEIRNVDVFDVNGDIYFVKFGGRSFGAGGGFEVTKLAQRGGQLTTKAVCGIQLKTDK